MQHRYFVIQSPRYFRILLLPALLLFGGHVVLAQQKNISGTIIDSLTRQPLMGAVIQHGTEGAIADTAGYFSLTLPSDTAWVRRSN